jgi:hypothetical protein
MITTNVTCPVFLCLMLFVAIIAEVLFTVLAVINVVTMDNFTATSAGVVMVIVALTAHAIITANLHHFSRGNDITAIRTNAEIVIFVVLIAGVTEMVGFPINFDNVDFIIVAVVQRATAVIIVATHNRYSIICLFWFEMNLSTKVYADNGLVPYPPKYGCVG